MTLANYLLSGGIGFASGLAFGLHGMPEKINENLEYLDAFLTEEDKKEEGLAEKIKNWRTFAKVQKVTLPACLGLMSNGIAGIVAQNHGPGLEGLLVSVPAAYLGKYLGNRIRRFAKRKEIAEEKRQIDILNYVRDHPDKFEYYLLTEEQRVTLNEALEDFEKAVVNGENMGEKQTLEKYLAPAYDALIKCPEIYRPIALQWGLERFDETMQNAMMQRKLKDFYEMPEIKAPSISCGLIGDAKYRQARIFSREGDHFSIGALDLAGDVSPRLEEERAAGANSVVPAIKPIEQISFEGNYREIADKILRTLEKEDSAAILISSREKLPEGTKAMLTLMTYLPAYAAYQNKERMKIRMN